MHKIGLVSDGVMEFKMRSEIQFHEFYRGRPVVTLRDAPPREGRQFLKSITQSRVPPET